MINNINKTLYIACFVLLGILLQQILHAVIELVVINFLISDFSRYGLGLSWDAWYLIHHIGSVILLLAGIIFGLWQGRYWWKIVYGGKKQMKHNGV